MPKGYKDSQTKCVLGGCSRTASSLGFCTMHYSSLVTTFREHNKLPERTITAGLMRGVMNSIVDPSSIQTVDEDNMRMLLDAMTCLSPTQRLVLSARYGIGRPEQTLLAVGKQLNCTRERVRQIELKALYKLRRWINLKLKMAGDEGLPDE